MKLNELQTTLDSAIATGKIGTPVALRVHAVATADSFDPAALLEAVIGLAETAFDEKPDCLTARAHATGRQWNVLLNYSSGQTLLVTLAGSSAGNNNLHLVLIGNRGIIRLEGAELFDCQSAVPSQKAEFWKRQLTASHSQNAAVKLDE